MKTQVTDINNIYLGAMVEVERYYPLQDCFVVRFGRISFSVSRDKLRFSLRLPPPERGL